MELAIKTRVCTHWVSNNNENRRKTTINYDAGNMAPFFYEGVKLTMTV